MNLIKRLYGHPTVSDAVGAKIINRASIIMMVLFAPLLIVSFVLAILTMNIFLAVQSGVWFGIVTIASMALQNGSDSARKGMMIIAVMNLLFGALSLIPPIGDDFLLLGYSILVVIGSAYVFFLMWGKDSLLNELSARRRENSKSEENG